MQGFKSLGSAQGFLSIHGAMFNVSNFQRHLASVRTLRLQGIGYRDMARGHRRGVNSDTPRDSLPVSLSNVTEPRSDRAPPATTNRTKANTR